MEEARHDAAVIVLGFDPGGEGKFGCAAYDLTNRSARVFTARSVDNALTWAKNYVDRNKVVFAGIDTLLFWQSTRCGWRGADEYLQNNYPNHKNSVVSSNGLYGSMSVQGAVLAHRLRSIYCDLGITETHPKMLWAHFRPFDKYPRNWGSGMPLVANQWIEWAGLSAKIDSEDEFDALISAWAAEQAWRGRWSLDLADILAANQIHPNISLVPDVRYLWPG